MEPRFGVLDAQHGPLFVRKRQTVTLHKAMALCVEVEDRNTSKSANPVTQNAVNV